ncbi:hypothetical protein BX600DRAFT_505794 [Xylariales sp. PMI_506]|nr:hypothetical protein BX600DRAFT_505794 [Xylariales sp. PMI_506]
MAGGRKYTDEQINFVLGRCMIGSSNSEIAAEFREHFNVDWFGHAQCKYIRNNYGDHPDFGVRFINKHAAEDPLCQEKSKRPCTTTVAAQPPSGNMPEVATFSFDANPGVADEIPNSNAWLQSMNSLDYQLADLGATPGIKVTTDGLPILSDFDADGNLNLETSAQDLTIGSSQQDGNFTGFVFGDLHDIIDAGTPIAPIESIDPIDALAAADPFISHIKSLGNSIPPTDSNLPIDPELAGLDPGSESFPNVESLFTNNRTGDIPPRPEGCTDGACTGWDSEGWYYQASHDRCPIWVPHRHSLGGAVQFDSVEDVCVLTFGNALTQASPEQAQQSTKPEDSRSMDGGQRDDSGGGEYFSVGIESADSIMVD